MMNESKNDSTIPSMSTTMDTSYIQFRVTRQSIVWIFPKPTTKQGTGNEADDTHPIGC